MSDEHEHEEVDAIVVEEHTGPGTSLERAPASALPPAPPAAQGGALTTLWDTRKPQEIVQQLSDVATALSDLIEKQDLSVALGGKKKHVEIEGWQTAGTFLGLQAMTVGTARVHPKSSFPVKTTRKKWGKVDGKRQVVQEDVNEWTVDGWSWEAVAEVRTMDGRVVGRGEAVCSRDEKNWFDSEESAVKGMAQTRAQSRAFKQALGFIVGMAGYKTTPAEEMQAAGVEPESADETWSKATDEQIERLRQALLWLVPRELGKDLWDRIKKMGGGSLYAPVVEALIMVINARKGLEELPEEKESPAKKKAREKREKKEAEAARKKQDAAATAPDAPPPDDSDQTK